MNQLQAHVKFAISLLGSCTHPISITSSLWVGFYVLCMVFLNIVFLSIEFGLCIDYTATYNVHYTYVGLQFMVHTPTFESG